MLHKGTFVGECKHPSYKHSLDWNTISAIFTCWSVFWLTTFFADKTLSKSQMFILSSSNKLVHSANTTS